MLTNIVDLSIFFYSIISKFEIEINILIYLRYIIEHFDYDKCRGCLKCVDVCEQGAIEVISIEKGKLKGFIIDLDKCTLCKICLNGDFCFKNLFELQKDENGKEWIKFQNKNLSECIICLRCFKTCPNNAILPEID